MEGLLDLDSPAFSSRSPPRTVSFVDPAQPHLSLHQDPRRNPQTGAIISKIEDILVANIDALRATRVLTIPIRSRRTGRVRLVRFPSSRDTEAKKFSRFIDIGRQSFLFLGRLTCFPPLLLLAALLQILHLSHEALVAGTVITKRSAFLILLYSQATTSIPSTVDQRNRRAIYYQNPELFGSQRYVDELVDDIAFTFGLGRDALNIVSYSSET